jgi:hypothetical protein
MKSGKLLALGALALLGCGDDVLSDPSFDRWCGERLCDWQTDEGAIARAPSWHAKDYAVELVDAPTQLSQRSDTNAQCFVVKMIADVDPASETELQVDFNDDGRVDYERALPRTAWKLAQFPITAPANYLGARFILRKKRPGRALVAQLRVESAAGCSGPAVLLRDAKLGALCSRDEECASGTCFDRRCAECSLSAPCEKGQYCVAHTCSDCADDGDCGDGERCVWLGASVADGRACVASDASLGKDLFAPCERDDECASGACEAGVGALSLCGQSCGPFPFIPPCGEGEVCRTLTAPGITASMLCAPPAELGARCNTADECASRACCENRCVPLEEAC